MVPTINISLYKPSNIVEAVMLYKPKKQYSRGEWLSYASKLARDTGGTD